MNPKAASFPKCKVGDDKCTAQFLTHLIQHLAGKLNEFPLSSVESIMIAQLTFSECPELGIPKMDPYELPDPFILQSTQLTSILTSKMYWTDIKAYGIDKIVIQEFRYILIVFCLRNMAIRRLAYFLNFFQGNFNFISVAFNWINPFQRFDWKFFYQNYPFLWIQTVIGRLFYCPLSRGAASLRTWVCVLLPYVICIIRLTKATPSRQLDKK